MGKDINVRARKGVNVGTGGNSWQRELPPDVRSAAHRGLSAGLRSIRASKRRRGGVGHVDRGLAGATALQTSESGAAITKTAHIGRQWGYGQLVIETDSPIFHLRAPRDSPWRTGKTSSW